MSLVCLIRPEIGYCEHCKAEIACFLTQTYLTYPSRTLAQPHDASLDSKKEKTPCKHLKRSMSHQWSGGVGEGRAHACFSALGLSSQRRRTLQTPLLCSQGWAGLLSETSVERAYPIQPDLLFVCLV